MTLRPQKEHCASIKEALRQMKRQYQAIPAPDDLKSQVEASIRQAKLDLEKESSPQARPGLKAKAFTHIRRKGFFASAAAAALAFVIFVNLKIPNVQVKNPDGEVQKESTDQLNGEIQAYTNEIIAAYMEDVKASGKETPKAVDLDYEVATDNDKLFSLRFHKTLTMASAAQSEKIYHIDKETGKRITLKDLFQEGADYKELISQNIIEQMKAQMEQDEGKLYYIAKSPQKSAEEPSSSEIPYEDGNPLIHKWDFSKNFSATPMEEEAAEEAATSKKEATSEKEVTTPKEEATPEEEISTSKEETTPSGEEAAPSEEASESPSLEDGFYEISEEANFYVNESGKLVVVFDEYEVAPGYMGTVSFEIPTEVVEGIAKKGYFK